MRKWLVVPLMGVVAIGGYAAYGVFTTPLNEQRMSCFMYEQGARLEREGFIPGSTSADLLKSDCDGQTTADITEIELSTVCQQYRDEQFEDPGSVHIYERLMEPCPAA